MTANLEAVFRAEAACFIFTDRQSAPDFNELIAENCGQFLSSGDEASKQVREKHLLDLAVSCLQYFVQNNWTGPPCEFNPASCLPQRFQESLPELVAVSLEVNGERIYELSKYPVCLLVSSIILSTVKSSSNRTEYLLWLMRCCKIHQDLLRERSPDLKDRVMTCVEELENSDDLHRDSDLYLEFLLEASHLCLFYFEYKKASDLLQTARDHAHIDVQLIGVMGKRTKFQEKELAQLVVKLSRKSPEEKVVVAERVLPKNIPLNSEVLLERVQAGDPQLSCDVITPVESAFLMTLCLHNRRLQAQSEMEEEETLAYLETICDQSTSWPVSTVALSMRSVLEKKKPKRFERTLLQLEELLVQFKHSQPPAECRQEMLYSSQISPIWYTEKELAHLNISYGNMDTALEIFVKLQLWPEAIECYTHMGRLEKAEKVIRDRLALGETSDLYCYLGDVTSDVTCYQKAWALSNERSARAQRSWALHLFYKGQFGESIDHFEKSLTINQLQTGLWFTYGCACMGVNDLNRAISAFKRCVQLEYDNYQAWTNLSACMAKSNEKEKALLLLEDALKCNFNNNKIWENYVLIATDCGDFEKVINGYNRLLDIKDKYVDPEVLSILVRAVNEDLPDSGGKPGARLRHKLQTLMGKQTSKVTTNADVWKLYAELISHQNSTVQDKSEKAIQHYQKCQRCLTQKDEFLTDVSLAAEVIKTTSDILKVCTQLVDSVSNEAQSVQMLASLKLSANNLLTKVKLKHRNLMGELVSDLTEPCSELQTNLDEVNHKITSLNS